MQDLIQKRKYQEGFDMRKPRQLAKSDKELVRKFKNIFKGRDDSWGSIIGWNPIDYIREKGEIKTSLIEEHLLGKKSIGIYPLRKDGTISFAVVDFDFHNKKNRIKLAKDKALEYSKELENIGITGYWFERSKSELIHIWLFFEKPVIGKKVRKILINIAEKLGINSKSGGEVEIFPKQDELDEYKVGNFINIPYYNGLNNENLETRVMLDPNSFKSISLESFLSKVPNTLIKVSVINEVYDKISKTDNAKKEPNAEPKEKAKSKSKSQNVKNQNSINPINTYPYSDKVIKIIKPYWTEGIRNKLTIFLAGYLYKQGIDWGSIQYIICTVAEASGDDEINQRLTSIQSTYDKVANNELIKGFAGLKEILKLEDLDRLEKIVNKKSGDVDKNTKVKYTARFDGLIDIVEHENDPHFLVVENGHAVLKKEVTIDNELFIPPPKNKLPWLLPSADKVKKHAVNDTEQKLFEDFENYLRSISDLPDDRLYSFITAWVFHTYLMEKWSYSPYLCFFAVAERGKSRTGKAIIHSSYRGRHTETLREANIFRASQNQGATLFFDCMDIWKKATKQNVEDLLLLRFEKGAKAERVLNPEKGAFDDTEYFDIFGATIIATNEPVHNILDTRCIPIVMQQSSKTFENDPTPEIGLDFSERFTAWRAKYLHKELSIQPRSAKGRLGDILIPIAAIIDLIVPKRRSEFNELVRSIEKDRMVEKSISVEGEVLISIQKCSDKVDNNRLTIKEITEQINEERLDKESVTSHKVGRVIRSLGFEPVRKHGGKRCIIFDESKLNKLLQSYGIEEPSPMSPDKEKDSQPIGIINKSNGDINGDSKINNDTQDVTSTTNGNHYINQDNKNDGDNGDNSNESKIKKRKNRKPFGIREAYKKSLEAKNKIKNKKIKQYL